MKQEKWYPVTGYENLYEISEHGAIRSLHRRNPYKPLSMRIDRAGYYTVRLSREGKTSTWFLHKLIALAFLSNINPDEKHFVNHKDGNKLNNAIENLEWVSHSENIKHAYDTGAIGKNIGANHYKSVLLQDSETGEIFFTIKSAAQSKCINYHTFRNGLNDQSISNFKKLN